MRDLARVLGAELAAPGAIERLRPHRGLLAAAELGEPEAHVDLVVARIEAVVDGAEDARVLKLAALAHELDPAVATSLLVRLGVEPLSRRRPARSWRRSGPRTSGAPARTHGCGGPGPRRASASSSRSPTRAR